ncbi:hypothetical protein GCM10023178_01330 [Actinomadura luteofluorescens]
MSTLTAKGATVGGRVVAGLAHLSLSRRYRTGRNDLLHDFYMPCLGQATSYDRAVGFFTAGSIALAAQGFGSLIERRGKVRLIACPRLDPSDLEAIERGYRLRSDQIAKRLLAELEPESITALNECARSRFELVTWLVAQNHLDFKIANVTHSANQGIYHEKIGLFRDDWRNEVAFSGSSNESISGISLNFESFNVFRSWVSKDIERLQEHREDFEDLWSDRTPGLEVIELPEAVKKRLIELAPDELPREIIPHRRLPPHPGTEVTIGDELYGFPVRPSSVVLYEHQREALRAWIDAGSQGVLSMATGTGKTLTALSGMSAMAAALRQADRPLFVLIVAPYKILVRQWATQAGNFGADSLLCYDSASKWVEQLSERLRAIRQGFAPFALAITTTATFSGPWMKEAMQQAPKDFLVIADEVHNLGSDTALKALPDNASMRIGLTSVKRSLISLLRTHFPVAF